MQLTKIARTDFAAAVAQIANERKIDPEKIYDAIKQALLIAYRKQKPLDPDYFYKVDLNEDTGEAHILRTKKREDDDYSEASFEDVTPGGFGRIAAQTAKQVILQKIRQSEKEEILEELRKKVGEIVSGKVFKMKGRTVIFLLNRGQGEMPPEEQMRGEFYRQNAKFSMLVKEIRSTKRGQIVILSRSSPDFIKKLFEREIPEIASGTVKIVAIAREAGVRTKVAVKSEQPGIDPVGACVGQRGVRIMKVIEEVNNEKIDVIPFSEDIKEYISAALGPAENLDITINEDKKHATIVVPDDQVSLAIGKGAQNVRLAAKLVGYRITIKSAGGKVQTEVSGKEEYEIDMYDFLDPESRKYLVENKLTTLQDLSARKQKWVNVPDIDVEVKKKLLDEVAKFEKENKDNENILIG